MGIFARKMRLLGKRVIRVIPVNRSYTVISDGLGAKMVPFLGTLAFLRQDLEFPWHAKEFLLSII